MVDLPGDLRVSILYYNASTNKLLVDEYGTSYGGTGISVPFSEALATASYNWENSHILYINNGTESNEKTNANYIKNYTASGINLFKGSTSMYSLFISSFAVSQDETVVRRLVPALRNSDGVPGMFDTVSKQFFENAGTGVFGYRVKGAPATYSLRDPHRVAPSGVWARLAADGALDAVAETELDEEQATAQGYAYFANTADAAEVLGVTEQELI